MCVCLCLCTVLYRHLFVEVYCFDCACYSIKQMRYTSVLEWTVNEFSVLEKRLFYPITRVSNSKENIFGIIRSIKHFKMIPVWVRLPYLKYWRHSGTYIPKNYHFFHFIERFARFIERKYFSLELKFKSKFMRSVNLVRCAYRSFEKVTQTVYLWIKPIEHSSRFTLIYKHLCDYSLH